MRHPGRSDPPDFVTGPSSAARRVERLTIRKPVGTALDLGTGSGLQALLTARHAEHVVGVDINARGLAFARFNAALNGLSNIDFREGSWFEPVGDERFDLIVANPPYVVSPDSEFLFRDGDLSADAVTQMLLQEVPAHLEEGGLAHVMGNWAHGRDEDWRAPVETWLAGSGCDVLLLRYATVDPVLYAGQWNQLLAAQGREAFLTAVDRWLDYYRREGIEAITEGMVVLRRRPAGRNWVRAIEVPGRPHGSSRRPGLAPLRGPRPPGRACGRRGGARHAVRCGTGTAAQPAWRRRQGRARKRDRVCGARLGGNRRLARRARRIPSAGRGRRAGR